MSASDLASEGESSDSSSSEAVTGRCVDTTRQVWWSLAALAALGGMLTIDLRVSSW